MRDSVRIEIESYDGPGPGGVEVSGIEAIATTNLEHPRVLFQDKTREDATFNPQAVVRRIPLPVLVEKMIEPFRFRLNAPLHGVLRKMSPAHQYAHEPVDTLQDRDQQPPQQNPLRDRGVRDAGPPRHRSVDELLSRRH